MSHMDVVLPFDEQDPALSTSLQNYYDITCLISMKNHKM